MSAYRRVERPRGTAMRPGFTLIEVLVVVLIMGVVAAIALPQTGRTSSQRSVNSARDAFIRTAAQARAAAIRTGDRVEMHIDPVANRVSVITLAGDTVALLDLRDGPIRARLVGTHNADGQFTGGLFRVCYVPRGYALPSCGSSDLPGTVTFDSPRAGSALALVTVGQAERR